MVWVGGWDRVFIVAIAGAAWCIFGCASVGTGESGFPAGIRYDGGSGGSVGATAAADSLDVIEDALLGAESATSDEQLAVLAEEMSSVAPAAGAQIPASAAGGGAYLRFEGVDGYREVLKAEAGMRRRLQFGVRRCYDRSNGYAELIGIGALERLILGGVRPRLGEGLLLGARYSLFGLPRMSRLGDGMTVSPTASVWSEQRGAAGTVGLGVNKITLAGWRETDQDDDGDEVYWASFARRYPAGVLGMAAGTRRARPPREGTGQNGGLDAALFAGRDSPSGSISGELARYQGRVFAAFRSTVRAESDWNLELFNGPVPGGFSSTVIVPGDLGRHQWGGAVHRVKRYRRIYTRASLYSNGQRSESKLKTRRRVELTGRGTEWEISFRFTEEITVTHSTQAVEYRSCPFEWRQIRCRLTWGKPAESGFQQLYRLQLLAGGGTGVLGSIGLGFAAGVLDARFQINNYALAPGQTGYATRPGIAGYETVSVVTGTGSDLSSRIRVNMTGRGVLSFYWGQPWRKAARWYAGVRLAL